MNWTRNLKTYVSGDYKITRATWAARTQCHYVVTCRGQRLSTETWLIDAKRVAQSHAEMAN